MIRPRRGPALPSTDNALLRAADAALSVRAAEIAPAARPLVVIVARAGDETLCCGALIHAAARGGARVDAVCLTQGASGIAARQRAETEAALACLAPDARLHWIGEPAGELPARGRHFDDLARRLAPLIAADATVLLPWQGEPLADLALAHALVRAAMPADQAGLCHLAEARFAPGIAVPQGLRLLTAPPVYVAAKRRAMGRHEERLRQMEAQGPALAHFLQFPEIYLPG